MPGSRRMAECLAPRTRCQDIRRHLSFPQCRFWPACQFANARYPHKCRGFSYPGPRRPTIITEDSVARNCSARLIDSKTDCPCEQRFNPSRQMCALRGETSRHGFGVHSSTQEFLPQIRTHQARGNHDQARPSTASTVPCRLQRSAHLRPRRLPACRGCCAGHAGRGIKT